MIATGFLLMIGLCIGYLTILAIIYLLVFAFAIIQVIIKYLRGEVN